MSWLVDIMIVSAVIFAAINGRRRGFFAVGGSLLALFAGLIIASLVYKPLGRAMAQTLSILPSLANIVVYALVLVVVQFLVLLLLKRAVIRLPTGVVHSRINQVGGVILAGVQMVILIAIVTILATSLPGPQSQKQILTESKVARPLIELGARIQGFTTSGPISNLTETLNLLTVSPESETTIQLGFTTTSGVVSEQSEAEVLRLVNRERVGRGLKPLASNTRATEVAREHSRDMLAHGYFSHKSLNGDSPFDRMKSGNVRFGSAGENLALAPTVLQAHTGLMNSPGHKANILSPTYKTVGIGVIDGGQYGLMITQDFTD